jgi:uncharacterized protein YceH (UPF0502 family)
VGAECVLSVENGKDGRRLARHTQQVKCEGALIAAEPQTDLRAKVDPAQRVADLEAQVADLTELLEATATDMLARTNEPA